PARMCRPRAGGLRGRVSGVHLRAGGLDLDRDRDAVADQHAAALQCHVPGQAEVLAGDLSTDGEADDLFAGLTEGTVELHVQGHRLGHAVDGQVPVQYELFAVAADRGAGEGPFGILLGVPEVRAGQVLV